MNLDFLFGRWGRGSGPSSQREPHLGVRRRDDGPRPALAAPEIRAEVRFMSPRQMSNWAHEMYVAGAMSWQEYQAAIPTELHPDYDATIGALTGEPAAPDRPRDMVKEWEERLDFFRRYNVWDARDLRRTERIVTLLRRQVNPHQWQAAE